MIVSCALLEQVVYHKHIECGLRAWREEKCSFSAAMRIVAAALLKIETQIRVSSAKYRCESAGAFILNLRIASQSDELRHTSST